MLYILADDLGYGDGLLWPADYQDAQYRSDGEGGNVVHAALCRMYGECLPLLLMTGLHTGHTQVRETGRSHEGQQLMREDTYTLGKLMKSAGYMTSIFSKWGLRKSGLCLHSQ